MIPTIDLTAPPASVAAEIDAACRRVGFFQIVGHGIDPVLEHQAWQFATAFFALPLDDKLAVAIPPGHAYGYGPFRVERLAASLGVATPPDLKETFSIGPFVPRPAGLTGESIDFVYSPNRWPTALPGLGAVMRDYYDVLAGVVARLMSSMAAALDLPTDWFKPFIDRHTSALRLLHYPDLQGMRIQPGQLRAGAHSDYGTLTLLRQDDAPGGLQVRDVDGTWRDVPCVPDAYVVNVGDALARWTNDRWVSTLHRVVVPPAGAGRSCERQSIAFFHNANWDASLDCLPTCRGADNLPRYESVTAGEHLMQKFLSTQ